MRQYRFITAAMVSFCILMPLVGMVVWMSRCMDTAVDYSDPYKPKEPKDTVVDGVYTYHRKGAVISLQSINKEVYDPLDSLLTYQPPGAEKPVEIHMRLADIDLFTKAIEDFRYAEQERIRLIGVRKRYENYNYIYKHDTDTTSNMGTSGLLYHNPYNTTPEQKWPKE